jgi:hypothetical protein
LPCLVSPVNALNTYFIGESTINSSVRMFYRTFAIASGDKNVIINSQQQNGGTALFDHWENHDGDGWDNSDPWGELSKGIYDVLFLASGYDGTPCDWPAQVAFVNLARDGGSDDIRGSGDCGDMRINGTNGRRGQGNSHIRVILFQVYDDRDAEWSEGSFSYNEIMNTSKANMDTLNTRVNKRNFRTTIAPNNYALLLLKQDCDLDKVPDDRTFNSFWSFDGIHLNDLEGAYLMALVEYAVAYRRTPVGMPSTLPDGTGVTVSISPALARYLQDLAWKAVTTYPYSGVTHK